MQKLKAWKKSCLQTQQLIDTHNSYYISASQTQAGKENGAKICPTPFQLPLLHLSQHPQCSAPGLVGVLWGGVTALLVFVV